MVKRLSTGDLSDLITGAEVLGCGGGGTVESASELIERLGADDKVNLVSPAEVPSDGLVFIVGSVGGGVPKEAVKRLGKYLSDPSAADKIRPILRSAELLGETIGQAPFGFIPTEIGAGNMMVPILVSAFQKKYIVDGDCCGRAKPEVSLSTTNIAGVKVAPLCLVNPFGEEIVVRSTVDDQRAEDIARAFASVSAGSVGCARAPMTGKQLINAVIPGSISYAVDLGRTMRVARERNHDVVEAIIKKTNSKLVFEGRTTSWSRTEAGSFMTGRIMIEGVSKWKNHRLRVDYKNEYLVSFLDRKPYVTCPDLIIILDKKTGSPFSNWGNARSYVGRDVVVLFKAANEVWNTPKGLSIFSPRHFGYDFDHKPLSETL